MSPATDANNQSLDDFAGLSPREVHQLLYRFLDGGGIVRINKQADIRREAVPLLYFVRDLLERLAEKEITLTKKGNLPLQLVKEWYRTGLLPDEIIESGITKLSSEDDYVPAQLAKHLPLILGWIKKRHNKLSLTVRGSKAQRLPEAAFFKELFCGHVKKFNLAWPDGYGESTLLQQSCGFLLYLLVRFGSEDRPSSFYSDGLRRAFPPLEGEFPGAKLRSVLEIRILERCLHYYGLIDLTPGKDSYRDPAEVRVTPALEALFRLDRSRPPAAGDEDGYRRQLQTALFDAEMGSQSYTSDDLPLELVDAFQAEVRRFEEQAAAGQQVPIRSLLEGLVILSPQDISEEAVFRREGQRLVDALAEIGVRLPAEETGELNDRDYYTYLHDQLLPYPIVAPTGESTRIVPRSEVLLNQLDPTEALTECFLLAMFRLSDPFPADMLASSTRLDDRVVPRDRGLAHILAWRKQWSEIVGLAFDIIEGPEVETPSKDQTVQFFLLGYQAINATTG
ncbi:MAG: hypothetical protein WA952_13990, partial [Lewinella sp.]